MSGLSAGFARTQITPSRGTPIAGYYVDRFSEGVLDELHASALALREGEKTVLMISVDNLGFSAVIHDEYRQAISAAAGVPAEAIFIASTHTHTAPYADEKKADKFVSMKGKQRELIVFYREFLGRKLVDVSLDALADLKPARMGYAVSRAEGIAFLRRYRMKDGSVRTNPGVNNPEIDGPIGVLDDSVSVVRLDREGAPSVALVSTANHADVVGGNLISADWPGFLCATVEKALDNVKCIFFNGPEGDVNHVNVRPTRGYLNDLFMDFDDVARGYGHARHMGRLTAGSVLQVWDKVEYCDEAPIRFAEKTVQIPSNRPLPEEIPAARHIYEMHAAGRDAELPYKAMMLTTMVADARRKLDLENGPDSFPMKLIAVSVGPVAFVGIPGEPFNRVESGIKERSGWAMTVPCCLVNGMEGYFPMMDSYEEGGYEALSSHFHAGVAEIIIDESAALLKELAK